MNAESFQTLKEILPGTTRVVEMGEAVRERIDVNLCNAMTLAGEAQRLASAVGDDEVAAQLGAVVEALVLTSERALVNSWSWSR